MSKVLVVDDSKIPRSRVIHELNKDGHKVFEAEDENEAMALLEQESFDIYILDVELDNYSGFEICRYIREKIEDHSSPIIFMSATDTIENREKGYNSGGSDYITKGELTDHIRALVNRWLHSEKTLVGMSALVVDDQGIARLVIKNFLRNEGVKVTTVESGEKAISLVEKNKFDMIISDHSMEGMSGIELTQRLRQDLKLNQVPIFLVTADRDSKTKLAFFGAGGTDYLTKPVLKEELIARLRIHLEHIRYSVELQESIRQIDGLNKENESLFAACSHDLKNPINAVQAFADFVLEDESISTTVREDVQKIRKAGVILEGLANDIVKIGCLKIKNRNATAEL